MNICISIIIKSIKSNLYGHTHFIKLVMHFNKRWTLIWPLILELNVHWLHQLPGHATPSGWVFVKTSGPDVYDILTEFVLFWRPLFENLLMLFLTKTGQFQASECLRCHVHILQWNDKLKYPGRYYIILYWKPYLHIFSISSPKVKHFFKINTLLYWPTSTGFIPINDVTPGLWEHTHDWNFHNTLSNSPPPHVPNQTSSIGPRQNRNIPCHNVMINHYDPKRFKVWSLMTTYTQHMHLANKLNNN